MLVWAGAWLYWSGAFGRMGESVTEKFYAVTAENGFIVQDVLVKGRKNADPEVLLGLLNVERGTPIFAFNPDSAREQLERVTWIESARVERRLPGIIYVSIRERKPFALWQTEGKIRLIDSKGVVVSDVPAEMAKFSDLPLVVGDGAQTQAESLMSLVQSEPLIREQLDAAVLVGGRRWDMKLKTGTQVRLPDGDVALALRRLAEAQETDRLMDRADIDSIDLTTEGRIVLKTRPGAVQDYKASFKAGSSI